MEFIDHDACINCKRVNSLGLIHEDCKRANDIDGCLSIFYYTPIAKRLIKNIKYHLVTDIYSELFSLCREEFLQKFKDFKTQYPDAVLQPVPLHPKRQSYRGFNQATIISTFFHELLSYPEVSILQRVKHTPPLAQTDSRVIRYRNIQNAFAVTNGDDVKGKTIILVDDVVTSGSTTREAAKTLKRDGADKVFVFSLAHG